MPLYTGDSHATSRPVHPLPSIDAAAGPPWSVVIPPTMSSMNTPSEWRGTGSPSSAITVGAMSMMSTAYVPSSRHSSQVFLN